MANSYLSRTPSSAGSATIGTFSAWVKRSTVGSGYPRLFHETPSSNNFFEIFFRDSNELQIDCYFNSSMRAQLRTHRKFADTSGWYHIVVATDSSQGTAADRIKVYVNGTQETSFAQSNYPSSGANMKFNGSTGSVYVGRDGSGNYMDGYISHAAWVDGQQLAPTVFGETDSTSGIWKFKSPTGVTWGTNGFHLKFENSANLGLDSSGNTNNMSVNGNLKQALDTPSNVHATSNPLSSRFVIHSNGNNNVFFDETGQWRAVYSTLGASSGKWYMEAKVDAVGGEASIGVISAEIASKNQDTGDYLGKELESIGYFNDGRIYKNNSNGQTGLTSMASGTIVGIAMDLDNNTVQFYNNGSPVGSTTATTAGTTYLFGFSGYSDTRFYTNFGNGLFGTTAITSAGSNGNGSLFEYDVPSGFYALNTKNINTYG